MNLSLAPAIRRIAPHACLIALAATVDVHVVAQKPSNSAPIANARHVLVNTCLITRDVDRLVGFYEPVLQLKAIRSGSDYAEFHTGAGVLAIFSGKAQEAYMPGSSQPGDNKSLVLEFQVDDVDKEYARLQPLVKIWVKPPTTQPWGTRSFHFRDPDGNLVDFFQAAN